MSSPENMRMQGNHGGGEAEVFTYCGSFITRVCRVICVL